ncbi:MAG: hypothetical protein HQ485_08365 [Acidobacteria bacterium]|nr:hypothetical protein [Acidobacteriota bacterium]
MMTKKVNRRSWMSGVGAAAAGMALGAGSSSLRAAQPVQTADAFQPARHELDAWFDTLPGQHRVILDCTSIEGAAEGIGYATNVYSANLSGYEIENADLAIVLCLRHMATAFAFDNTMWAKYGTTLGDGVPMGRNGTAPHTTNPRNSGNRPGLDTLAGRGAHFAVCGLSTRRYASLIARAAGDGADPDTVFKELSEHTIPNAHIMAAGVVAVTRAQEYGYSLIHVG